MPPPMSRPCREALEDVAYLQLQINRGVTLKDLAATIGVGRTALKGALRRSGIGPARQGRRPKTAPRAHPHTGGIAEAIRRQCVNDARADLPPNRQLVLTRFAAVANAEKARTSEGVRPLFWALIELAAAAQAWAQYVAQEDTALRRSVQRTHARLAEAA